MDNVTQRLLANALCIFTLYYDAFDRFSIEPSGCRAPIFTPKCVAAKVVSHQQNKMEPSCCHVATSERRRIHSRADYCCIALREASIRRSQRGNNSATPHTHFTTFAATPLSTYLSCVGTARRSAFAVEQHLDCQATIVVTNSTTSHCRATVIASHSIATTRRALHNRHHLQSTRTPTAHHDCNYFCHHTSTTYKYNIKETTLCLTL